MIHCIIDGTQMRVFVDGICEQGRVEEIPPHDVPVGHYEADGGRLRALQPRDVSHLARNGRSIGARVRWVGQDISINGLVLPPAEYDTTMPLDVTSNIGADSDTGKYISIFVSVNV